MRTTRLATLAALALIGPCLSACGDDESSPSNPGGGHDADAGHDAGHDAARDVVSEPPPADVSPEAQTEAGDAAPDAPDAPPDAPPDAGDGGAFPEPTPDDIQFEAVNPIPSGEYLLFNDWNPAPNRVYAVTLDGQTTVEIFRAYRVWSMGVSRGNDRIAFACGDPDQEQNYGLYLGDAIQHTWIYDVATQTAQVVAYGNINDECHTFGPDDERLYVCRRYDFTNTPDFKGWRIGVIDLSTLSFSFITPEQYQVFALHPQPTLDETEMYYGLIDVPASPPSGVRSIQKTALPSGVAETVREKADSPLLSPDGSRYLFRNYEDGRNLWSSTLDGQTTFQVVAAEATEPVWSPDGTQVAYLLRDNANNCDHIYVAAADGSQANAPTQVRDCAETGEFITELDWIKVP